MSTDKQYGVCFEYVLFLFCDFSTCPPQPSIVLPLGGFHSLFEAPRTVVCMRKCHHSFNLRQNSVVGELSLQQKQIPAFV